MGERIDVIVRFLAVLELYKQGMVDLAQATTFGDLHVTWLGRDNDTPLDELEIEEYAG
jgi:segregation and condensation protein A